MNVDVEIRKPQMRETVILDQSSQPIVISTDGA